jgi:hypothetical protein
MSKYLWNFFACMRVVSYCILAFINPKRLMHDNLVLINTS